MSWPYFYWFVVTTNIYICVIWCVFVGFDGLYSTYINMYILQK